jgi:hypothetical protein
MKVELHSIRRKKDGISVCPARSESLSMETKANVHFLFSKQPDNKKNRVKTAGQTSSSSFHFSGTGKMIK